MLGAALAATYDVNLAATARAADFVEAQALRWVAELIGFPESEGAFTSGGMTSNLTALLAAREDALPGSRTTGFDGTNAAVYCSAEAHHSVVRAAEAVGLGEQGVRRLAIDADRRVRPADVAEAIAADRARGVTPIAVVANGGTTLTGAVDPLDGLADVCADTGVWLHVDGAYGLPAAATDRARHLFAGLERVDSVTLDAHKWLGMQKPCSVVLVRRPGALERSFGHEESYIRRTGALNLVERTLEYSRPINSLKLWLALRTHGAAAFRGWIEHTLGLAAELTARCATTPSSSCCTSPSCPPSASATCPPASTTWTPTTPRWPRPPSATAACSWPTPWSTTAAACACASSTSAPAPRTWPSPWTRCARSAATWPEPMRWVVDAMNVIGTRPDGWWRDRDAAMARLVDRLERYSADTGDDMTVVFERKPNPPIRSTVIEIAHATKRGPGRRRLRDREDRGGRRQPQVDPGRDLRPLAGRPRQLTGRDGVPVGAVPQPDRRLNATRCLTPCCVRARARRCSCRGTAGASA